MQAFKLEIELGNEAFGDNLFTEAEEVARILRQVADRLLTPGGSADAPQRLFDINGNYVGETKVVTRRNR